MFWKSLLFGKIISRLRVELYTIFFYGWLFPVLLFQIIILVNFPTFKGLLMLILGLIANLLFNNILAGFDYLIKLSQLLKGFIEKFEDCHYTLYKISDYLDENVLKKAQEYSFGYLSRKIGWQFMSDDIEENIYILVVKKGQSKTVPEQFTTYSMPFDKSYIFMRDEPNKIRGMGKFFLHHEIGHTLYVAARHKMRILFGNRVLFFLLFWSVWNVNWTFQSFIIAISLILVSITMMREWNLRIKKSNLEDEIWADIFSISSLSKEEIKSVSKYFSKYSLSDSRMDKEQNTIRVDNLKLNLNKAIEDKTEYANNIPYLLTFENISDTYAPLDIVTSSLLVIVLGICGKEPTTTSLITTLFCLDLPLVVALTGISFLCVYFKQGINRLININDI